MTAPALPRPQTAQAVGAPIRVIQAAATRDAGRVSIDWPADLYPLQGHYPGFPIVPGVFLVETADRAVRAVCGPELRLSGVRSTRFLRPVFPGDTMLVEIVGPAGDDGVRVAKGKLTVGGEPVCQVTLEYGGAGCDPDDATPVDVEAVDSEIALGQDVAELLPHRYPMLLVDRLRAIDPGRTLLAEKAVCMGEWCFAGGPTTAGYPWPLVVESWCQSAGVLAAWARPNPDVTTGQVMLFGGMSQISFGEPVRPGDVMRHHVELARDLGDVIMMAGRTTVGGRTVMTAQRITMAMRPAGELAR